MGFNWDAFGQTALKGLGAQVSVNYNAAQDEQRKIREDDRTAQTQMSKEKQMTEWRLGKEQDLKKSQAAEAGLEPGTPRYNEFMSGIKPSAEESGTLAAQQKEAQLRATLEGAGLKEGTPEYEKAYKEQMGLQPAQTAAQANQAAAMAVYDKLKDGPDGEKVMTERARMQLATLGVSVPGEQKPLTATVKKDIWKEAKATAEAKYSPDILPDEEAINQANNLLAETGRTVKNADAARAVLIQNETMFGYATGVTIITGQRADTTPSGKPVPEETKVPGPPEEPPMSGRLSNLEIPKPTMPTAEDQQAMGQQNYAQFVKSQGEGKTAKELFDLWKVRSGITPPEEAGGVMQGAGNTSGRY